MWVRGMLLPGQGLTCSRCQVYGEHTGSEQGLPTLWTSAWDSVGASGHGGKLSSISGAHPLDARSTPSTDNHRCPSGTLPSVSRDRIAPGGTQPLLQAVLR